MPEFSAGAMENPGCVTFSERLLFRSKVTDMMYELRAMVILHEMAHMWFGDLVTMKWWDDLWLNESFAEFSAALASAEATRFTDAWTTFSGSRKTWGYMQDQLPSTHPIAADVPTLSEAIANFDGISYAKGASVLKQLAAYVGRDNFFAGIRAYFAEYGHGNATLASLLAALEHELRPEPRRLVEGVARDRRAEHPAQPVRGRRRRPVHRVRRAPGGAAGAPDAAAAPHRDRPVQPGGRRRARAHAPGRGRRHWRAHRGARPGRPARSRT